MDARRFWLMVLGAGWIMAWAASIAAFWVIEPTGEGWIRGVNRVRAFLGWQAVAGFVGLAVWGVGRGWPKGSAVRRLSRVPLGLAGLLILAIGAAMLWVRA